MSPSRDLTGVTASQLDSAGLARNCAKELMNVWQVTTEYDRAKRLTWATSRIHGWPITTIIISLACDLKTHLSVFL